MQGPLRFSFSQRRHLRALVPGRTVFGLLAWGLALVGVGLFITACDLGSVSGEGSGDTTKNTAQYASVKITNGFTLFPGDLTFRLYGRNATTIADASPLQTLGEVKEGTTVTFKVPVGVWKLGYTQSTQATPMPDRDNGAGWPSLNFVAGGSYTVVLFTEESESRNYWSHNIPFAD